jgi:hypothetical protein
VRDVFQREYSDPVNPLDGPGLGRSKRLGRFSHLSSALVVASLAMTWACDSALARLFVLSEGAAPQFSVRSIPSGSVLGSVP